jgi:hypothetical protein
MLLFFYINFFNCKLFRIFVHQIPASGSAWNQCGPTTMSLTKTANHKSANFGSLIFFRFADLPQTWQFADL